MYTEIACFSRLVIVELSWVALRGAGLDWTGLCEGLSPRHQSSNPSIAPNVLKRGPFRLRATAMIELQDVWLSKHVFSWPCGPKLASLESLFSSCQRTSATIWSFRQVTVIVRKPERTLLSKQMSHSQYIYLMNTLTKP